jgi:hypothetical protein
MRTKRHLNSQPSDQTDISCAPLTPSRIPTALLNMYYVSVELTTRGPTSAFASAFNSAKVVDRMATMTVIKRVLARQAKTKKMTGPRYGWKLA